MPSPRLLALDLDGTLLRDDKTVAPDDADAVAAALAAGVTVTMATGRLRGGSLPLARALGLDAPLITADGGLIVAAATGVALERTSLALAVAERVLDAVRAHDLAAFVFTDDIIHCDPGGRSAEPWITTWAPSLVVHEDLPAARAWREPHGVAAALGMGPRAQVVAARAALERAFGAEGLAHFGMGGSDGPWLVRLQPPRLSKGRALATLAGQLGVAQADVAAVGDWVNDLDMLAWAGTSFAMGQAPAEVRQVATHTLAATSRTGGGVAEAIRRWLRLA